ncbi:MAG: hypothetical protein LKK57_03775 [Atopobiaceae bacterium]|nr:hypothetical protein [Atopobiaceae bacterium]
MTKSDEDTKDERDDGSHKGFMSELSVAQVIAPALASLTSFLLASQIGIAGSVIGVVVGSVVATMSSQLYRHVLDRSAEKIKAAAASDSPSPDRTTLATPAADETRVVRPEDTVADTATRAAVHAAPGTAASGTPLAPQNLRDEAAARHRRKVAVSVAVVGVVCSLLAVALVAFVINLTTAGEGIGTKPEPTVREQTVQTTEAPAKSEPSTQGRTEAAASTSAVTSPTTQEAATTSVSSPETPATKEATTTSVATQEATTSASTSTAEAAKTE